MAIRIFNNTASTNAQRYLGVNNQRLATSIERISSGIRINKGADDAAGLAISEGLRSDIRALRQATRNANDGLSLLNVTEGALNEQSGILIRLRELASQAATGTVGSTERATIQLEFSALRDELTRIAMTTEFNGIGVIDGTLASSKAATTTAASGAVTSVAPATVTTTKTDALTGIVTTVVSAAASGAVTSVAATNQTLVSTAASGAVTSATTNDIMIQIGIDNSADSRINLNNSLSLDAVTSSTLGVASLSVTGAAEALTALAQIENAIASVTATRGKVGAVTNRLQRAVGALSITSENLQAAESSIRDADIAHEIAQLTRNQILVQTSTAMVGQSNLIPQSVLQLLA
jgi:flagellin